REWQTADRQPWAAAWAADGDRLVVAEQRFAFEPAEGGVWGLTLMAMLDHMQTRITRIAADSTTETVDTELDASCSDRAFDAERLVCTAFDGTSTHLLTVAPAGDAPQPIGTLAGRFVSYRSGRGGWLSGWVTTGTWIEVTHLAVDVAGRRALVIPPELRADEFTATGDLAATLWHDAASTHVRLYRLP